MSLNLTAKIHQHKLVFVFILQVYFYEYSVFSKPVDKPRQCLPYGIVTVKFIGQKMDIGHLTTSLRLLTTGFPKRPGKIDALFYFSGIVLMLKLLNIF